MEYPDDMPDEDRDKLDSTGPFRLVLAELWHGCMAYERAIEAGDPKALKRAEFWERKEREAYEDKIKAAFSAAVNGHRGNDARLRAVAVVNDMPQGAKTLALAEEFEKRRQRLHDATSAYDDWLSEH